MNDPRTHLLSLSFYLSKLKIKKFLRKIFFIKSLDEKYACQKLQDLKPFLDNAHFIDIVVRKDGKEYRYQADFLKYLKG